MSGSEIVELILDWAGEKNIHPDDFHSMFVPELLEMMETDV